MDYKPRIAGVRHNIYSFCSKTNTGRRAPKQRFCRKHYNQRGLLQTHIGLIKPQSNPVHSLHQQWGGFIALTFSYNGFLPIQPQDFPFFNKIPWHTKCRFNNYENSMTAKIYQAQNHNPEIFKRWTLLSLLSARC